MTRVNVVKVPRSMNRGIIHLEISESELVPTRRHISD